MKKKNTMPERDWQQTHEKIRRRELRKCILVMGLTVAMVANTVDLSALSVSAKTDESETGKTTIVSFEELSKDITEQTLPIGALESDIKFPTSLTVTVEKTTQADEKEADDEEDASETGDTETMRRRMTVMEILRPLMIRRIQHPQMKRMAIPAMRMLPISLVLLTMEMQIQRIRIHQRILEILTNQTTQMALAALIQRIHRHVPTYPLLLVRLLARWRMPFCRINS